MIVHNFDKMTIEDFMTTDRMYTVKDVKAEVFLQPFFTSNLATATRMISDCLADTNHPFSKHPEDYALYQIGEWDVHTGCVVSNDTPQHLINIADLRTPPEPTG